MRIFVLIRYWHMDVSFSPHLSCDGLPYRGGSPCTHCPGSCGRWERQTRSPHSSPQVAGWCQDVAVHGTPHPDTHTHTHTDHLWQQQRNACGVTQTKGISCSWLFSFGTLCVRCHGDWPLWWGFCPGFVCFLCHRWRNPAPVMMPGTRSLWWRRHSANGTCPDTHTHTHTQRTVGGML